MARPRVPVDTAQVRELRARGLSWPAIARYLEIGLGTAYRAGQEAFQNSAGRLSASDRPATRAPGFWALIHPTKGTQ